MLFTPQQILSRSFQIILAPRQVTLNAVDLELKREAVTGVFVADFAAFILEGTKRVLYGIEITVSCTDAIPCCFEFRLKSRIGLVASARSYRRRGLLTCSRSAMSLRCVSASFRCRAS